MKWHYSENCSHFSNTKTTCVNFFSLLFFRFYACLFDYYYCWLYKQKSSVHAHVHRMVLKIAAAVLLAGIGVSASCKQSTRNVECAFGCTIVMVFLIQSLMLS